MSERFLELVKKVEKWAEDRKIIPNSTAEAQATKTQDELDELMESLAMRCDPTDDYGDILVTLIIGARLAGVDLTTALAEAYDEIKDRKGFMDSRGIFIKEADIPKSHPYWELEQSWVCPNCGQKNEYSRICSACKQVWIQQN